MEYRMSPDHARMDPISWPLVSARRGFFCQPRASHLMFVQVRGTSEIASLEGRFTLRKGEWIAFEADANAECLPGAGSIAIAACVREACAPSTLSRLLSERGILERRRLAMAFKAWRAMRSMAIPPDRRDVDWYLHPWFDLLARGGDGVGRFRGSHAGPRMHNSRLARTVRRIRRGMLYLHGNAHRAVPVPEVADFCRCSPWHVSKMFQYVYGEGPREACVRLRIERACRLLGEAPGLAIGEIAGLCGFGDASSFARMFKQKVGVAASEYRNRCTDLPQAAQAAGRRSVR